MVSTCDMCGIRLESEGSKVAHLKGKKHQLMLKELQRRQEAARKSIFVRNFQDCCSDVIEELKSFFTTYGVVVAVHIDKNTPMYAIVEFQNEENVTNVLDIKDTLPKFHDRKLIIKQRNAPTFKRSTEKNSKEQRKKKKKTLQQMTEELLKTFTIVDDDTIEQQMVSLVSQRQLTVDDNSMRNLLCDLIQQCYSELDVNCEVLPFGSAVNGFGQSGSDLDLTLLIEEDTVKKCEIYEANVSNKDLEGTTSTNGSRFFWTIASFMKKCIPGCSNVIALHNARQPVIKFRYNECNLSCDLTINNRLAITNSQLLREYSELDCRVKPLVATIRTWAYCRGITLNSGGQFTTYSLILMIIFFLQCTEPSVLPSLQALQQEFKLEEDCKIGIWDCSFLNAKSASRVFKSTSTENLVSLLRKFFCFYATLFNYDRYVISAKNGEPTATDRIFYEVGDDRKLIDAMEDFKVTCICVQDPLLLNHNTTQNVNKNGFERFRREARIAMNGCVKVLVTQANDEVCSSNCNPTLKELFQPVKTYDLLRKYSIVLPPLFSFNFLDSSLSEKLCVTFNQTDDSKAEVLPHVANYFYVLKHLKYELDIDCGYNMEVLNFLRQNLKDKQASIDTITLIAEEIERLFDKNSLIEGLKTSTGSDKIISCPSSKKGKWESIDVPDDKKLPHMLAYCKVKSDNWTRRRHKRRVQERMETTDSNECGITTATESIPFDSSKQCMLTKETVELNEGNNNSNIATGDRQLFTFALTIEPLYNNESGTIVRFDLIECHSIKHFHLFYAYVKKSLSSNLPDD